MVLHTSLDLRKLFYAELHVVVLLVLRDNILPTLKGDIVLQHTAKLLLDHAFVLLLEIH